MRCICGGRRWEFCIWRLRISSRWRGSLRLLSSCSIGRDFGVTCSVDTQSIVILDFGSQYTQLIARRIREQNVFSAVLPCTASLDEIRAQKPLGIILSGGPCSVYD